MSAWDGEFLPAPSFHPEFGYLCPSAGLRHKLRSVVITLAAGTVIAGSMALALLSQLAPQPPGDVAARLLVQEAAPPTALPPIDQAAGLKARGDADEVVSAAIVAQAVVTQQAAASRAQASCDDLSGSFLASQCRLGKAGRSRSTHAAHAPHGATNPVAVTIGRADAAPAALPDAASREGGRQDGAPHSAAARPTPVAETAVALAPNEAAAVAGPKPPAPAKKPVKMHRQAPDVVAPATVPATPSHGFDLFALFHQPPRTGIGFFQ